MKASDSLHLAALLHDIGKFRMRATDRYKRHQEHSYEFVSDEHADFFSPCGDAFKNAIRHHHPRHYPGCSPTELQHLIEKQIILADRLSATEREDEEREGEDFVEAPLVSILSRLKDATQEYRYPLTDLTLERNTVIPSQSPEVNQEAYAHLWKEFTTAFRKITTKDTHYTPAAYQTIVALLEKYTSRMPSATPWGRDAKKTVPDISLYDHLRTTAAIAVCIGRELSEADIDACFDDKIETAPRIGALIKGDISGIQSFLYQILSEGAARELRGRSFYLQLLTEAIAHWVLKQFDLPITNLLLASGGHFYILAPYREAREKLDALRRTISENLWGLHKGDLSCILAGMSMTADDFKPTNFSKKWHLVSQKVRDRKRVKWSEMGSEEMFKNFFEPHEDTENTDWGFGHLGQKLREATYLIAFDVPESPLPDKPDWRAAIQAFGWDIHLCTETGKKPAQQQQTERAIVYRLGDTDFLEHVEKFQRIGVPVSYDFKVFQQVTPKRRDAKGEEVTADYDHLADASEGAKWLGALRMDVDDLGKLFTEKLQKATISRVATLSESLRLFFEGYVPQLCREYNDQHERDILELIYAGGDDLFLVGGWSALPEIAKRIRSEFREFITGDHITLSGGIAIEHKKYPLYQFAEQSGAAEEAAKRCPDKDAITFLRKPMKWADFDVVSDWHQKFLAAMRADRDRLPTAVLTRLNQIYKDEKRWAWRSLYYFHRLQERYKGQRPFLCELQRALNVDTSFHLREFIHIITRWTALHIRNKED